MGWSLVSFEKQYQLTVNSGSVPGTDACDGAADGTDASDSSLDGMSKLMDQNLMMVQAWYALGPARRHLNHCPTVYASCSDSTPNALTLSLTQNKLTQTKITLENK